MGSSSTRELNTIVFSTDHRKHHQARWGRVSVFLVLGKFSRFLGVYYMIKTKIISLPMVWPCSSTKGYYIKIKFKIRNVYLVPLGSTTQLDHHTTGTYK